MKIRNTIAPLGALFLPLLAVASVASTSTTNPANTGKSKTHEQASPAAAPTSQPQVTTGTTAAKLVAAPTGAKTLMITSLPPQLDGVVTLDEWQRFNEFNLSFAQADENQDIRKEMDRLAGEMHVMQSKLAERRAKKISAQPDLASIEKKVMRAFQAPPIQPPPPVQK